jgi:hypothetical protein
MLHLESDVVAALRVSDGKYLGRYVGQKCYSFHPSQTQHVFHDRNYKKSPLHLPSLSFGRRTILPRKEAVNINPIRSNPKLIVESSSFSSQPVTIRMCHNATNKQSNSQTKFSTNCSHINLVPIPPLQESPTSSRSPKYYGQPRSCPESARYTNQPRLFCSDAIPMSQ